MTWLGTFAVRDEATFNESRRKLLRLAQDLGFDEIGATRLAAAYSEFCRLGLLRGGVDAVVSLESWRGGLALGLRLDFSGRIRPHEVQGGFLRDFGPLAGDGNAYRGVVPLPDHTWRPTPAFLEDQRARLAHPSREELLRDLKAKNEALSRSEQRTLAVLEGAPDALLMVNEEGRITYLNPQTERVFGYAADELLGQSIDRLVPAAVRPGHGDKVRSFFAAPRQRDFGAMEDLHAETRDGRTISVDVKLNPIVTEQGTQVIVSCRDVTEQKKAQEEVKKLSLVVAQSPVSVVITDREGRIEYVNPAFCANTGYAPAEVLGQNPRILNSGLTPPETFAAMWAALSQGSPWRGVLVNRRKDGSVYWEDSTLVPIQNAAGEITHFAAVKEDITQRMQNEQELARQRTLLDTLVNALPQLIYSKDTGGVFQIANNALCSLLGRPAWEVVGRTAADIFPAAVAERVERIDRETMDGKRLTTEVDCRVYPDGRKAFFDMIRVPILDDQGEVSGLVGAFADITERLRMEEAVRESELKYRELVENANSIILKLDMAGRITFFNEFAQKFFGYSQEEILGRAIVGTIVPESESTGRDLAGFIADLVANPGQYERNENENVTRSGERVWVGWTNQALTDAATGERLGLLCVGSDVTAQKIAQMQRDEALELLSGSIRYASRIQQAVLPPAEHLAGLFAEHFVLWQPRDVVGGDIYWSVPWGDGGVFVLGDCTGHGVPGAFMTLITTGALAKALRDVAPGDVAGLVGETHRLVQTGLGQHTESGGSDDGMELGVCYIPADRSALRFCGARFTLFVRGPEGIEEVKGDRRGIGYRGIPLDFPYEAREVAVAPGREYFMTTDGLPDQIGGEKRRSYGKKRFLDLLAELSGQPLAAYPERIIESLLQYQGAEKRRDDVSVAGFRLA
jgi:PAS domain S-box-containing protein